MTAEGTRGEPTASRAASQELRDALAEWDSIEGAGLADQFRAFIAAGKMADAIRAALGRATGPE